MQSTQHPLETKIRLTTALLAMVTVAGASLALADLKPTAPKDVNLTALWKINPQLSDDPRNVLAKKRDEGSSPAPSTSGPGGPSSPGYPGGRGGHSTGGIDAGDIFGGTISGTIGHGRRGGGQEDRPAEDPAPTSSMPLDSFLATREQFEIEQRADALTVRTVDEESTCKPGETAKVPMQSGELVDQRCGWEGGTFVIETKTPDGVTRTNRYQLRNNDKQLVMVSSIKGGRGQLRGVQIKRVYERLVAF
jgi:hypothetical protein